MRFKLMADSTCDLSDELIEKYDIGIAPLSIQIGDNTFKDRIDIQPDEFYNIIETIEGELKTSMPTIPDYLAVIEDAVDKGHTEILCINMSSGTSGSYQGAVLARNYFYEKYPDSKVRIEVVDSKSMSHGSGLLILKAAKMRDEGISFDEILEFVENHKTQVKHFLAVDDMDHLIRSGRLSNTSAIIGKMLNIKPVMSMKKGRGSIVAKKRGRKQVLKYYVEEYMQRADRDLDEMIIIGYTSDISIAENLRQKLQDSDVSADSILIMQMGVAVGTHVGLGGISLFFFEKSKDSLIKNAQKELTEKKNEIIEKIKHLK